MPRELAPVAGRRWAFPWPCGPDGGTCDGGAWRNCGDTFFDGGESDLVDLRVGGFVDVTFPRPVVETICDDLGPFLLEPSELSLRFVGRAAGATHCGFWFAPQPYPNRYVLITVGP